MVLKVATEVQVSSVLNHSEANINIGISSNNKIITHYPPRVSISQYISSFMWFAVWPFLTSGLPMVWAGHIVAIANNNYVDSVATTHLRSFYFFIRVS